MKTVLVMLYLLIIISYLPWIITTFSWGTSGSFVEYLAILGWGGLILSSIFLGKNLKRTVLIASVAALLIWTFQGQTIKSFLREGESITMLGLSIVQAILLLAAIYSSLNYFIALSNLATSTRVGINVGVTILLLASLLRSFTNV